MPRERRCVTTTPATGKLALCGHSGLSLRHLSLTHIHIRTRFDTNTILSHPNLTQAIIFSVRRVLQFCLNRRDSASRRNTACDFTGKVIIFVSLFIFMKFSCLKIYYSTIIQYYGFMLFYFYIHYYIHCITIYILVYLYHYQFYLKLFLFIFPLCQFSQSHRVSLGGKLLTRSHST